MHALAGASDLRILGLLIYMQEPLEVPREDTAAQTGSQMDTMVEHEAHTCERSSSRMDDYVESASYSTSCLNGNNQKTRQRYSR